MKLPIVLIALIVPIHSILAQSSWVKLPAGLEPIGSCVEVNPRSHGQILYTAAISDPFPHGPISFVRSDDAGKTWKSYSLIATYEDYIHQIFCLPADTSILFALGDSVFRSTDGGSTWSGVLARSTDDGAQLSYNALTNTLYFSPSDSLDVWTSTDHGARWSRLMSGALERD